MINICMHIPGRHDATNWYRGSTPLNALRTQTKNRIQTFFGGEYSYSTVQSYDAAFFQRPCTPQELEAVLLCKRNGVPVIVDYDDLLLDLPRDNPSYGLYMNDKTRDSIIKIVQAADLVWVSTKELKRCYQLPKTTLNERVYVVPNALNDIHLAVGKKAFPPPMERRQPAVLWRGSHTHERDVMEFVPEIVETAHKFPHWSFVFAGWNPWFVTEHMKEKQAIVSGALPVGEFMDFVYATGPQVGMIPLSDHRFNRCKSNIAWLEMAWAGAACLVPDWEEWRNPGCVTYRNSQDFKAGLMSLIAMKPEQRCELNRQSWEFIEKNYMLSKVNDIRLHTIEALLGIREWPNGWQRLHDDDCVAELE